VTANPPEPRAAPEPPGRYRRALGATLPTLKFLPSILIAFTLFGGALAYWAGIGIVRGFWQGAIFGLIATAAGATFTFIRFAAKPELLGARRSE
jgi:hypothetical protein